MLSLLIERREPRRMRIKLNSISFDASSLNNIFGTIFYVEALTAICLALQLSINFFDISPYYHETIQELVLGRWLRESVVHKSDFVMYTKCGIFPSTCDRALSTVPSTSRCPLPCVNRVLCSSMLPTFPDCTLYFKVPCASC